MTQRLAAQPIAKLITARAAEISARAIADAGGIAPEIAVVIATSEPDSLLYVDRLLKQVSATGLVGRRVELGATATEPIDPPKNLSEIFIQLLPPSVVFQTPPPVDPM